MAAPFAECGIEAGFGFGERRLRLGFGGEGESLLGAGDCEGFEWRVGEEFLHGGGVAVYGLAADEDEFDIVR